MAFPVDDLTSHSNSQYVLHEPDFADHDYHFEELYHSKIKRYNISHRENQLCILEIVSLFMVDQDCLVTYPGSVIPVKLYFNASQIPCTSIKISLLQTEERCNNTKVQVIFVNIVLDLGMVKSTLLRIK